jgi:hypothetical protein
MAKQVERSDSPAPTTERMKVDWKYAIFYIVFFCLLMMIAYFGVISEV